MRELMETDPEILKLLREIRDIQTERLALQKKSLDDTEKVQKEVLQAQAESIGLQRRGGAIQKGALVVCALLIALALFVAFR
jgi:hypothetical protein